MPELLHDKIAIVTGAAQGLGFGVAEALASEGATVVLTDIDEAGAKAAADKIDGATHAPLDVRDDAAVEALIGEVAALHGKVDVVVANAGIATVTPLAQMTFELWRSVLSVNLDGVFSTVRHGALSMAGTGGGSIIAMASITGLKGSVLLAHYGAAKAGVINLCQTAALEFKDAGIRVNAICPGFIDTELVRSNAHHFEEILGIEFAPVIDQAQGRLGQVADVAPLAVFLASDRSRFSTGSAFVVDGGMAASLV